MTGHEQVIFALVRVRITHESAASADRSKLLVPSGDQLVRINLVARVPDQPIATEVKNEVQCDDQFNYAEVAGEVGRPNAQHPNQLVANLLGKGLEFGPAQALKVGG